MSDEMHVLQVILYGFTFLIIGLICVQLCSMIKFPLTHHTFIIIAGAFIGQLSYLVPRLEDPMLIDHIGPLAFLQMYVPLLFFSSTVSTEVHYLKVMLFHLALTVVPTMILCCVVVTLIGFYLSPLNWAPEDYILMIAMTMTCGPQITKFFTSIMSAHNDLRNMIQSESLFGNCLSYIFYRAVTSKLFKRPLYLVFLFMSDVVLGIFFGYVMGKLMMLWISKIFKDSVNQTTIILASIYAAFAICEIYRVSGMLCVVTMGLVVANQKASMSTQSMAALNKFVELLLFLFTSVGSVQTGIYLSVRIIPMLTVETLLMACGFYFMTFLLRSLVLIVTSPFSSSYVNSRSLIYAMCVCHLRGTFSCMLTFTLMDTRLHATINNSLFVITLLQILMSFVINYALSVATITYINMKLFSKDKVHMIERAAKMLIEEKRNTSHTLKRTM